MRSALLCFLVSFTLLSSPTAYGGDTYSLTIYSKASPGSISPEQFRPAPGSGYGYGNASAIPGYAIIRQGKTLDLPNRDTTISLTDVAAFIDPTTVVFKSRSYPDHTHVLEQDYLFDLVNQNALLNRYLGKNMAVEQVVGDSIQTYEGTLMGTEGGLILQDKNKQVITLNNYSRLRLPELPGGLITKPTLLWHIQTDKPGKHEVEISYQSDGITWWADYNMVFTEKSHANEGALDLHPWVSIVNQTGTTYPEAALKLMAGDVQRITPTYAYQMKSAMPMAMAREAMTDQGFAEKAFFEYHLYTLGRPITLPNNATKQLELFPAVTSIPVNKEFMYNGQTDNKVGVFLKFKNSKQYGLGIPLPAGRARISKRDTDGSLEFIGEDVIKHTAKDEEIRLKLGNAFDIVGERKQLQYRTDTTRKQAEESIEIILRNHKEEPVNVIVEENLNRYANWQITQATDDWKKHDAFTIRFPISLRKDEEKKLRYTVRYSW